MPRLVDASQLKKTIAASEKEGELPALLEGLTGSWSSWAVDSVPSLTQHPNQVKNWYAVPATGGEDQTLMGEEEEPPAPKAGRLTATTPKSRYRVMVTRDSLLRRTETSICRSDGPGSCPHRICI